MNVLWQKVSVYVIYGPGNSTKMSLKPFVYLKCLSTDGYSFKIISTDKPRIAFDLNECVRIYVHVPVCAYSAVSSGHN